MIVKAALLCLFCLDWGFACKSSKLVCYLSIILTKTISQFRFFFANYKVKFQMCDFLLISQIFSLIDFIFLSPVFSKPSMSMISQTWNIADKIKTYQINYFNRIKISNQVLILARPAKETDHCSYIIRRNSS